MQNMRIDQFIEVLLKNPYIKIHDIKFDIRFKTKENLLIDNIISFDYKFKDKDHIIQIIPNNIKFESYKIKGSFFDDQEDIKRLKFYFQEDLRGGFKNRIKRISDLNKRIEDIKRGFKNFEL